MGRRKFIALLGSAAAWSVVAHAQQSVVRIGFLPLGSPSNRYDLSYVEAFRKGLVENDLIDGKNVVVDLVWVANEPEYDQAVVELIRRGAKILVPAGSSASVAAKRQTSTIPIIFISVGNPVGIGIVQSLSRPGGNATGFTDVLADLSSKLVDFAREINAQGSPVGYLWFDKWPDGRNRFAQTEAAAQGLGVMLCARALGDIGELDAILGDMRSNGVTALVVQPSPFTYHHRDQIIAATARDGFAMICAWPQAPSEGALIGYGPDYSDIYRSAGSYISRITKGENPSDLPVQNPVKFHLGVNLKAARALGVIISTKLLALATEVIE
jgi:putative ABC transport system substrate-binding protein